MDWNEYLYAPDEKPLDRLVSGYSHTSVFRRIGFIGDSLSSGEFETRDEGGNPGYHDLFEYSWGQYIARANGLTAYNFSRGGMTAKEYIESFAESKGFWDPALACQAYVIALGENDFFGLKMPLGSLSDINVTDPSQNKESFLGYYGAIISRYKEISPDAKFFLITFPKANRPNAEETARQMAEALYGLCDIFDNCYVIDLQKYGPVYGKEFRDKYFLYGHMTPSGYILTAHIVDSYIDYIVRHNPEDFKNAGFIGSGIKY